MPLAELLSRKSVPAFKVARPRPAPSKVTPGDAQRRLAGFVEGQLQRIALEQVDAVERRFLRTGVDLLQHVVVLRHQAVTDRPAVDRATAAGRRQSGERRTRGGGGSADRADGRRGRVVRRRDVDRRRSS